MEESSITKIALGLLALGVLITGMNSMALSGLQTGVQQHNKAMGVAFASLSAVNPSRGDITTTSTPIATGSAAPAPAKLSLAPKGIPPTYGAELGISFDDVSANDPAKADATIRKLATIDQSVTLSGDQLNRYIKITNQISCEYCCGVPAITDDKGNAACGCAHSYAMRGLGKYLIQKHGSELSDDQILEELGKWKALFFPDAIDAKGAALQAKGLPLTYINLASNKYRGIEKQAAAGGKQVGGC